MDESAGLGRFLEAQDDGGVYAAALRELRAGRKRGHWIWFVFPQLTGLGRSPTAQRYAVTGLPEARAYLSHPVLGARLRECVEALLALPGQDPEHVMGSVIDAVKLRSSMTLFAAAAGGDEAGRPFQSVLDRYFEGQPDDATLRLLGIDRLRR